MVGRNGCAAPSSGALGALASSGSFGVSGVGRAFGSSTRGRAARGSSVLGRGAVRSSVNVGGVAGSFAGAAGGWWWIGLASAGICGGGTVFGAGSNSPGSSESGISTCEPALPRSPASRVRIPTTTSSSSELECVFLSATPRSGSNSRIRLGFTSSSLASSLMRILLIVTGRLALGEATASLLPSDA